MNNIMKPISLVIALSTCVSFVVNANSIPEHPRLLVDAKEFETLKGNLENTELGHIAKDWLLYYAQESLSMPLPKYKKDASNKRILHISRQSAYIIGIDSLAYRITGDERFARRAIDIALTVSAFPDWNPSHFLDTAEMTFAVGLAYDWLYDLLKPEEKEILYQAILHKGLIDEKGDLRHGWWTKGNNNWCQVCHGGLTAGAIAIAEREPKIARKVIDRAVKCLPIPMAVFAPDGGFPEGPSYWSYALVYNVIAVWAIEKFDGTDHGLCSLPGFAAEVDYQNFCTGPTKIMFNYSDAGASVKPMRESELPQWWLAKRFNRLDTLSFCEIDALRKRLQTRGEHSWSDLSTFLSIFFLDVQSVGKEPKAPLARIINGENPIAVMRTSWTDPNAWYVAMKGGKAICSHGHQDSGSFILEANGVRWAYDLGCEPYAQVEKSVVGERIWDSRQSSPRWKLFRYSTAGHGTLQFNDEPQLVNALSIFSPMITDDAFSTTINLSAPYQRDVKRTWTLNKKGGLVVCDRIRATKKGDKVTWRINTLANVKVQPEGNVVILSAMDNKKKMRHLKVTANPKSIRFVVVDKSKGAHDYEKSIENLKQLCFTTDIPDSGELELKVSFESTQK